ncbi:MAG: T9SS type A sorting domain-containing protein [bacterium]
MMRKEWLLVLLICLAGCIPKGFIITEETEDVSECPQLIITSSLDPVPAKEITTITIVSDKPLVNSPTVIITQHYEKRGTDITQNMETIDQFTWQGTYTAKPGYEGNAMIEVLNALDEDGNKGYGTTSFEVILQEEEAKEIETDQEVEYEEIQWHDIRGEYGEAGAARAPMLVQGISNNIACIAGDDRRVWFGTNYGIGQYDRLTQGWVGFLNKGSGMGNSIRCLFMDDDIIWFGSQGDGLFRYQESTHKWIAFPEDNKCPDPNINDIVIVNNIVWVATDKGLAKYDTLLKQWIFYTLQTTYNQLNSEKITKLTWLYPNLWVGTDKGLMSYDPVSDVWQDQTGICSGNINCLFMDKNDLWIGTPDKGIIQYNTTNNGTKTYTVSNGLCSNSILSLAADTNHVFVGHSGGISKLNKSNDTWMSFTHTMAGDAIRPLDDVQAVYLENDGNPWIGMNTGLIDIAQSQLIEVVQPTIIELNPTPNTVLSTAFPEITAKYEDNISGSGIDPIANLLWIDGVQVYGTVTAQEIHYKPTAPLAEGEHSFEIRVADNCGNIATRKNTFSVTLPKLSYKLLVSQLYVKPGQEVSVTIEASEKLQGTPTASLSFANSRMLFIASTSISVAGAPSLKMENGTLTGTSTTFGSWTTIDRKKWQGTTMVPINAVGIGTVTIANLKDIHNREPKAEDSPVARIKAAINDESGGIIAPQIISIATSTIASVTTNIITGTATRGSFVNLIVDGKIIRTVRADESGIFIFKNIRTGTSTTATIKTSATDITRIASDVSEIAATPNLLIDFPGLVNTTLKVRGVTSQSIGTISGNLVYGTGSVVPLNITAVIDKIGDSGWVGTARIPSGVKGSGTLTIFATTDTDNKTIFTGTLRIDTIPPGTPTIEATKTFTSGWIIYGTATEADLVELWSKQVLYGTTTLRDSGRFVFKADPRMIPSGTTTLRAVGVDKAGNRTSSKPLVISPQGNTISQTITATQKAPVSPATIADIRSNDGGTITISGKRGQTTLKIPPDALAEDSRITIIRIEKTAGKLAIANFNAKCEKNMTPLQDSHISLVCTCQANGKPVLSATQAMKLCIPYNDDNHDGIIDETNIRVETLRVFKLNEASNRWDMITDSYPVNARCEVWANINEFGVYAVMSYEQTCSLSDVRVYPNPFYPDMDKKCTFSPSPSGRFTISIHNSAGEQVRILRQCNEWNGNNDHEDPVASGVYFYIIKNAEGKTTGKIGLIR